MKRRDEQVVKEKMIQKEEAFEGRGWFRV